MRHFIFVFTIVSFLLSCGQSNTKQKDFEGKDNSSNPDVVTPKKEEVKIQSNTKQKDFEGKDNSSNPNVVTPKKEEVKIQSKSEQNVVTNSLESDAKRYAELLCIVQRQGQTEKIVKEMQEIVDRYPKDPESTKFGKIVDQEFNRYCK